jgi:hypothetical protein
VHTTPGDGTRPKCATNTANSAPDVVPREGIFMLCFSFFKHIGVDLIMPPYTIDEGLDNTISRKHGYTNLVSPHPSRAGFPQPLIHICPELPRNESSSRVTVTRCVSKSLILLQALWSFRVYGLSRLFNAYIYSCKEGRRKYREAPPARDFCEEYSHS